MRSDWQTSVERLRESLVGWWGVHTTLAGSANLKQGVASALLTRDFIEQLQDSLQRVFPDTAVAGIAPRAGIASPSAADFFVLLERDGVRYDIAEMSSGEQAVFPLLYEFVRLDIAHSIVLIDELELHLHPPQQQALLAALPKLGPDCQFIITTHSPFLEQAIPDEDEVRLEGGRRCL